MRKWIAMVSISMFVLVGCSDDKKTASVKKIDSSTKTSKTSDSSDSSDEDNPNSECTEGIDCKGDPFADADEEEVDSAISTADSLAASLSEGMGAEVSEEETGCIVSELFSNLDLDQIKALGSLGEEETPDPEQLEVIGAAFDECLSRDTLVEMYMTQFGSKFPEEVATCAAERLADEFNFSTLMQIGLAADDPNAEDVLADFEAQAEQIGSDCGALTSE